MTLEDALEYQKRITASVNQLNNVVALAKQTGVIVSLDVVSVSSLAYGDEQIVEATVTVVPSTLELAQ